MGEKLKGFVIKDRIEVNPGVGYILDNRIVVSPIRNGFIGNLFVGLFEVKAFI